MSYKPKSDETEFGGRPGFFPDEQLGAPTLGQQMAAIYATDEGDTTGERSSVDEGRAQIGEARESFSVGQGIDLTAETAWGAPE